MKRIVIIDTVGSVESLVPAFRAHFPFVSEWAGYEADYLAGEPCHPHGAMCCEKALQPLFDVGPVKVYFLRVFDANGVFSLSDDEILSVLGSWADEDTSRIYVNCSWGMYVGGRDSNRDWFTQAEKWRDFLRKHTNVVVTWASGNDGDYQPDNDNDMPQSLLTDCSFKIGSMALDGVPSKFSSDSTLGRPICVYWAEDVKLFNGVKGTIDIGSGTSFAAPMHTGLMCRLDLDFQQGVEFCRENAIGPVNERTQPHPKFGYGTMQHMYGAAISNSPYLLNKMVKMKLFHLGLSRWFDMREVSGET